MRIVFKLVKRNSLNYLYDKTSVFFSLLSVFIIILLYAAFLAKIQVDSVTRLVGEIDGIRWLIDSWILAGVITANSITVPLSILSEMINDLERGTIDDFLAAPISRKHIVLGYMITSWIVGILISTFTLIVGQGYVVLAGGEFIDLIGFIKAFGLLSMSVIAFSSVSFLVLTFIRTVSAVSVINTLVGTLIGFLAGVYMPIGIFEGNIIATIIKVNPAAHVASGLRQILMDSALLRVFEYAPVEAMQDYRMFYGVDISFGESMISLPVMILYLMVFTIIFFTISVFRVNKIRR